MKKGVLKTVIQSIIISLVGVFVVDYFSHLLFSNPMETIPYFLVKAAAFLIFSFVFLHFINRKKRELLKVLIGGVVVSLLWGAYYNVLPELFDYYPFGIALYGLSFLGMGLFGTGLAFGTVHTLAFILGYYVSKLIK